MAKARGPERLRMITYLSPGLPLELFEDVGAYLEEELGLPVSLEAETRVSAPPPGEPDPFSLDQADLGFLCAPGYFWLSARDPAAVDLVGAAFVFDDPRTRGEPVYFSDLVVAGSSPARALEDLAGSTWAYNDPCSLSGYFGVLEALAERGLDEGFFGRVVCAGSHRRALELLARGEADCAAIDSNYRLLEGCRDPGLAARIRVIQSFGPHPIQPIVARRGLGRAFSGRIARALLRMHEHPRWHGLLARSRVVRFAEVTEAHFAAERARLARCERVSSRTQTIRECVSQISRTDSSGPCVSPIRG